jgi:hypothetical protein
MWNRGGVLSKTSALHCLTSASSATSTMPITVQFLNSVIIELLFILL